MVMRSNPVRTFFYFLNWKYFTILFKILDLLRSLDRFKVLLRVILNEISMAWRENFTKIFTYRREERDVGPPMPRRWWLGSCPDWHRDAMLRVNTRFLSDSFLRDRILCNSFLFTLRSFCVKALSLITYQSLKGFKKNLRVCQNFVQPFSKDKDVNSNEKRKKFFHLWPM